MAQDHRAIAASPFRLLALETDAPAIPGYMSPIAAAALDKTSVYAYSYPLIVGSLVRLQNATASTVAQLFFRTAASGVSAIRDSCHC
jgi:hypothetical protein